MFDTLIAIVVLLAFVLPGFIVTQLAESRRATKGSGGDLEIALRSLWYSVALHLIALTTGWTSRIYNDVRSPGRWEHHVRALGLFVGTVVFAVPVVLGLALDRRLRTREQRGQLRGLDYVLGGRDARQAWDYVFEHLDGAFVVAQLKTPLGMLASSDDGEGIEAWTGTTIVGKYASKSRATRTPSSRYDVFFEEVWPADAEGKIIGNFQPPRGAWVDAENLAVMYIVDPPPPQVGPGRLRKLLCGLRGCARVTEQ
jgi:Family of unknown function (DUF6338)